jgi:hypothetical protein
MASFLLRPPGDIELAGRDAELQRIALFLTRRQIEALRSILPALPRATREPLHREIDRRLAEHGGAL